jgi:hypothetical protein
MASIPTTNLPEPQYLNLEYFFTKFFESLSWIGEGLATFGRWLKTVDFVPAGMFLTLLFSVGIIFLWYHLRLLRRQKIASYVEFFGDNKGEPEGRYKRWDEIKKHMESPNPIDWKMAIIEADSLMDEIIQKIGYRGATLGERLKEIEPSDFDNLQNVWDAHKVRNRIAHDPGKVALTKSEADSIVKKYENALKELKYL